LLLLLLLERRRRLRFLDRSKQATNSFANLADVNPRAGLPVRP
jgi:hypothetical protein